MPDSQPTERGEGSCILMGACQIRFRWAMMGTPVLMDSQCSSVLIDMISISPYLKKFVLSLLVDMKANKTSQQTAYWVASIPFISCLTLKLYSWWRSGFGWRISGERILKTILVQLHYHELMTTHYPHPAGWWEETKRLSAVKYMGPGERGYFKIRIKFPSH